MQTNRALAARRVAPLLCALVAGLCAAPVRAQAPVARPEAAAPPASPPSAVLAPVSDGAAADLSRDARLNAPVAVQAKGQSLQDVMQTVAKTSGVSLRVDETIAQRSIHVFAARLPLRNLMRAIADVMQLSWRVVEAKSESGGGAAAYELYQTPQQKNLEVERMAASERAEARAQTAKREALLAAMREAAAARRADKPSVSDLLAGWSAQQAERAADLAAEPTGPISSSDQSHFHSHLIYTTPFASLPPDVQASVGAMIGRPEFSPATPGAPHFAPALENAGDLANSQVGIIAADGGVRLGVVGPDGKDVWVSPTDVIQRATLPDIDTGDDADAELAAMLASGRILDLGGVPDSARRKPLRFSASMGRRQLADALERVAQQTGLAIVSDAYVYSAQTPYGWLLTDKDEYALDAALAQIARAFAHRFLYQNGVLQAQTLTLGTDLRAEPPAALLTRLRALTKAKQNIRLSDYLTLGRLSRLQVDTAYTRQLPGVGQYTALLTALHEYDLLHLYALLTEKQRTQAESVEGVALRELKGQAGKAFALLADIGLPARLAEKARPTRAGLFVRREGKSDAPQTLTFLIASESVPLRVTAYRLSLP